MASTQQEGPFWFQVGAIGDNSSAYFTGVNITIRTVYDKVSQGGHSYWVGTFLSNEAFVQVGYVTTVTADNKPYCCAWFYEYFPSLFDINPPVIGPAFSAGPIGSWHTYSMLHVGDGLWSVYMDGTALGLPLPLGAKDSGPHGPAAIAEAAAAPSEADILGPAEFKDLTVRQNEGWRPAPSAKSLIFYGAHQPLAAGTPRNPYGVWEVEGVNDDFLAGSGIPKAGPVQVLPGGTLWPAPTQQYNKINFSFIDRDGQRFIPDWIALKDSQNWALYTSYENQLIPSPSSGNWTLDSVVWHAVNVAPFGVQFPEPATLRLTVQGNVFSPSIQVLDSVFSLPVSGAAVIVIFPDSYSLTQKTDALGRLVLTGIPPGVYSVQIDVPFGIPAFLVYDIQGPGSVTVRVLGIVEMITIFFPPAVAVVTVARVTRSRKNHGRPTRWPEIGESGDFKK